MAATEGRKGSPKGRTIGPKLQAPGALISFNAQVVVGQNLTTGRPPRRHANQTRVDNAFRGVPPYWLRNETKTRRRQRPARPPPHPDAGQPNFPVTGTRTIQVASSGIGCVVVVQSRVTPDPVQLKRRRAALWRPGVLFYFKPIENRESKICSLKSAEGNGGPFVRL
jgi:hypothetical protein